MPALIHEIANGRGPCECYQHAEFISALKKGMNGSAGIAGGNDPYSRALFWIMQNFCKCDCIRFLLRLKQVLKNPPEQLLAQQSDRVKAYWDTYGTVLGELINRDIKTNAGLQSQAYWKELFESFSDATPEQWPLRKGYITSFAETVDKCLDNVFVQSIQSMDQLTPHFTPFWECINDFLQYFEMSIECEEIPKDEISEALQVFLGLNSGLSQWICGLQSNNGSILSQTYLNLSTILERALPLIGKAKLNYNLGYERWFQSIRSLLSRSATDSFPGLREKFNGIAVLLYNTAINEKAPDVKSLFGYQLASLIPKLQYREDPAPKRKIPHVHFTTCHLKFENHQIAPLVAHILNICPRTYKGFCIETDEIQVIETIDYPDEVPVIIPGARNKKIKLKSLLVDITYCDQHNQQEMQIAFDCRIQRAWKLPYGGSGFALLDPTDVQNHCDTWVEYVDSLADGGRYQA